MTNPNIPNTTSDLTLRISYEPEGSGYYTHFVLELSASHAGIPSRDYGELAALIGDALNQYRIHLNSINSGLTINPVDVGVSWSVPDSDTYTP